MSFLATVGSSLLSGGIGAGSSAASGLFGSWIGNSSKESLNKNITKTNLKYQKEYDLWTQEQDKAYNQWWQNYLYDLQNNEYYKLSQKYATNTAKWAVDGLRRAGLNPILAAQNPNMSSNLGDARPSLSPVSSTAKGAVRGASISGGSVSTPVNLAALSQIGATASQNERNAAETDNIKADTEIKKFGGGEIGSSLFAVSNFLKSMGLDEPLKNMRDQFKKPLQNMVNKATNWMTQQLGIGVENGTTADYPLFEDMGRRVGEFFHRDRGNGVGTADPVKRAAHKEAIKAKQENLRQSEIERKKRETQIRLHQRTHTPWIFR